MISVGAAWLGVGLWTLGHKFQAQSSLAGGQSCSKASPRDPKMATLGELGCDSFQ